MYAKSIICWFLVNTYLIDTYRTIKAGAGYNFKYISFSYQNLNILDYFINSRYLIIIIIFKQ